MKPWERLQNYWSTTGFDVPTRSASEQEVAALEARYEMRLPDDFREYLLHSCPTDENAFDDHFTLWWPLPRIRSISEEYEHEVHNAAVARAAARYLFFADHAMWCWAWAIGCTEDEDHGRIAMIGSETDGFVANSFTEFAALYVCDFPALCR